MKIVFASGFKADSNYAYAINSVKSAIGYLEAGHDIHLITREPSNKRIDINALMNLYDSKLPEWHFTPRLYRRHLLFGLRACLDAARLKTDVIIARDYATAIFSSTLGMPTIMETHAHVGTQDKWFLRSIASSKRPAFRLIVTISDTLKQYYSEIGAPNNKIVVFPTGVNLNAFYRPNVLPPSPLANKTKARINALYSGHLYKYKGIKSILDAAEMSNKINFHLVGGRTKDIHAINEEIKKRNLQNVLIHGHKSQKELPNYLWHADVLLLPPSSKHPSANWTSPVKLGEYLASGTPIVATSIPALKRLLSNKDVEFVEPDNAHSLLSGIQRILSSPERAKDRSESGLRLVAGWSYTERSRKILTAAGF